jgi:hypothetical protein
MWHSKLLWNVFSGFVGVCAAVAVGVPIALIANDRSMIAAFSVVGVFVAFGLAQWGGQRRRESGGS